MKLFLVDIRRYDRSGGTPRLITGLAAINAHTAKEAKQSAAHLLAGEWEFFFRAEPTTPERVAAIIGLTDLR